MQMQDLEVSQIDTVRVTKLGVMGRCPEEEGRAGFLRDAAYGQFLERN